METFLQASNSVGYPVVLVGQYLLHTCTPTDSRRLIIYVRNLQASIKWQHICTFAGKLKTIH